MTVLSAICPLSDPASSCDASPYRTRAQSQPSSPRWLIAFTDTTVPGSTLIDAAGLVTRICCASGFAAGPHATM